LTHGLGWRSNFYLSAVLAVIGFGAARVLLPRESFHGIGANKEPFDFVGMVSFALSISLLLFALAIAQKGDWQQSSIWITLLAGAVALIIGTILQPAAGTGHRAPAAQFSH